MKMNWSFMTRATTLSMLLGALVLAGCSNSDTASDGTAESVAVTSVDHSHGGWWCVEHGVPEGDCARCDKSLVAKFKVDGDWCDEHGRPESQCFICSPKRAEKFIAQYEAKTGQTPPEPTE